MLDEVEVIEFPDAELVVARFLHEELTRWGSPAKVSTSVSSTVPSVRVLRTGTGSDVSLVVDPAQITVDCYAAKESQAAALIGLVRSLLLAAGHAGSMAGVTCYQVTPLGGPSNLPDPVTSAHRYTASFIVPLRGAERE